MATKQQRKQRMLIFILFAASMLALLDSVFYAVYHDKEQAGTNPLVKALAWPAKTLIESVEGSDHYSTPVYAWWTALYLLSFSFAFMVYFITHDKTFLLLGISSSFLIILFEDYMYYTWQGESPSWDGPFNWGFFLGLPVAYYVLFFGAMLFLLLALNTRRERRFWRGLRQLRRIFQRGGF